MRNEGLTQQGIGDKIGWNVNKVKQYNVLLNQIVTHVLLNTKQHQAGRATEQVTNVTFNFTEGWFRNREEFKRIIVYYPYRFKTP